MGAFSHLSAIILTARVRIITSTAGNSFLPLFCFATFDAFYLLGFGFLDQFFHPVVNFGLKAACQQVRLDLGVAFQKLKHGRCKTTARVDRRRYRPPRGIFPRCWYPPPR